LDSLADVVSFGVAPSLIIYQFLRLSYAREEDGIEISVLFLVPALFIALAAAYRLAKFNIESSGGYYFIGMPTPAVGILIASLPLIYWNTENTFVISLLLNKWFLYVIILVLCWLMLSNLKIMALKFPDFTLQSNLPKIVLFVASLLLFVLFKWVAIPFIFILYILLSLIFKKRL
jgi:CDP-diacylglycerol--serine O-phosphatidyltransferase